MTLFRLLLCTVLVTVGPVLAHPGQQEQLSRVTRHIQQQPDSQALYIKRGTIYSHSGQFEQARADFTRAQGLGEDVLVAFELGVLYYRMGEFERATACLDQYLQRFPAYAPAYEYRARAAQGAGDYQRALDDLNRYFQLQDHANPGLYISAANLLEEMGRAADALAILDQGLDTLGLTPQLQRRAIRLELRRQQPANAIARLETLREPLKENPAWKLEMAELLLLVGHMQEAVILLQGAEIELEALRATPARVEMLQRVRELQVTPRGQ